MRMDNPREPGLSRLLHGLRAGAEKPSTKVLGYFQSSASRTKEVPNQIPGIAFLRGRSKSSSTNAINRAQALRKIQNVEWSQSSHN